MNSTRTPSTENRSVDSPFLKAVIEPDNTVITQNDARRDVAVMKVHDQTYWFTTDLRLAPNGYDFWIVVQYFGFTTKSASGDIYGHYRQRFSKEEAASAQNRIVEYYSGPEDKHVFPFGRHKNLFLGVIFEEGWILLNE